MQIHNLPILCMKKTVVEMLGRFIGAMIRTQVQDEDSGSGRWMRVRVQVDISKPLIRGRRIGLANDGEGWVSFQYERLPNFCYWCGIPTHGEKDCEAWLNTPKAEKDKEPEYGLWLRASPERVLRRVQVTVEGRSRNTSTPKERKSTAAQPTQHPPRVAEVQFPPLASDPTDMETTEHQEGIQLATDFSAKNHTTFEDQLREIDMALNFNSVIFENSGTVDKAKSNGPEEELGPAGPIMPKNKVSLSTKDPRSPLGDITNYRAVISPKPNVGTWKKMAHAKGQGSQDTRKFAIAEKRACEEVMQIKEEDMRSLKTARVLEKELISVAAGVQPRRIQ